MVLLYTIFIKEPYTNCRNTMCNGRLIMPYTRKDRINQMGMAASQARLLSLTARLTDNEMRSQMISNSKVRLSDKTGEASDEYMNSLNTTQLQYMTYTSDGEKTYQKMNAGLVNEYGPLKNQYGLINTKNNIMVNGVDAENYKTSATLNEFLDKYKLLNTTVEMIENPKWKKQAELVYGGRYDLWLNGTNWLDKINEDVKVSDKVKVDPVTGKITVNDELEVILNTDFANREEGGEFKKWLDELRKVPTIERPDKNDPKYNFEVHPSLWDLWKQAVNGGGCWDNANDKPSGNDAYHVEHILTHLLDPGATFTTSDGISFTIPNNPNGHTSIGGQADGNWPAKSEETAKQVREKLNSWKTSGGSPSDSDTAMKNLQQKIVDIYFQSALYASVDKLNPSSKPAPKYSQAEINALTIGLMGDIQNATQTVFDEATFNQDTQLYENAWKAWKDKCDQSQQIYAEQLDILNKTPKEIERPGIEINDKDKAEWYTNLWYRMGGKDELSKDKDRYEILTENQLNNAEWLQFALENGILSMEQVKFETPNADYPELKTRTWNSIIYSSSSDIREQENELAITKAEVKYNKALKEIQYKDKEYDQDLKKLDTEHNAIQTEYDSLKTVIQKNTERSFKAFS